ncbi:Uracil-DNA glycosylase [Jeotgalibaca dankookensis]|uniref:Uracil-DNA glycosylase n=1 Tax=Jeotgalibaca dankookensis TaxID=708126 RepID=A0A1S6IQ32_9LACT|nr:uracil-DNA glycosylase [Jeotgalibaca dankookensis]AQS53656.1 Uracil-DNA glycosylase [Jeotgalibaca dankookensis]
MKTLIKNDWQDILESEFQSDYYLQLRDFLKEEYSNHIIYPSMNNLWTAFEKTPFKDVKVVILGQDPYHGPNQAHGLSFSVQKGVPIPPSLRNIYKELESDLGVKPVHHGHLNQWAEQGVLLLNTVLTVRKGQAYSHRKKGWEQLTDAVIHSLNEREDPVIFILWGNASIAKKALINTDKHIVLTAPHPSPLSARRGFFGSKPFSKTNDALKQLRKEPINWQLTE